MPAPHVGTYVGTGTTIDVTAPEFRPVLVLVEEDTGNSWVWGWDIAAVAGQFAQMQDGFFGANGFTMLANGFRVGSGQPNALGVTFHYVAIPSDVGRVGTYVGDGTSDRLIPTVVRPRWAWVLARDGGTRETVHRNQASGHAGGRVLSNGVQVTRLTAVSDSGFTVTNELNTAGVNYIYFVADRDSAYEGLVRYTGDGAANRQVNVGGMTPLFACVARDDAGAGNTLSFGRISTFPVDRSHVITAGIARELNFIEDFLPLRVEIGNNSLNGANIRHVNTAGVEYALMVMGVPIGGAGPGPPAPRPFPRFPPRFPRLPRILPPPAIPPVGPPRLPRIIQPPVVPPPSIPQPRPSMGRRPWWIRRPPRLGRSR